MSEPAADVAVVGAGPAGCAAAVELRRLGVARVALFDAGTRPFPVGESIPPDTRRLLERLGAWDGFAAAGHEPCPGSRSAWGSDRVGHNDFIFNPLGLGWHLDRARFDTDLVARAKAAGVTVVRARVRSVERLPGGGFRLHGAGPARDARFVVDAAGAAARVARSLGARRRVHDRLSCVVGFLDLPPGSPMNRLTMLEATAAGWWYAARLPGDRAVALLASDPETIRRHGLGARRGWRAALGGTVHAGPPLRGARLIPGGFGQRAATSALTEPAAGDGWLAVGDAAAAHDPITARGIHEALAGGLEAAGVVAAWLGGDAAAPQRYDGWVRTRFADYLAVRDYLYSCERRWEEAPFWKARLALVAA